MTVFFPMGFRHGVGPRNLNKQTHEKVCIWCVFESDKHSARVQKLNHGLLTSGLKPDFLRAF